MNVRSLATRYAAIDWKSPRLKAFDYSLASLSIGYGIYAPSFVAVACGVAGLAATYVGVNAWLIGLAQGAMRRRVSG